MTNPISRRPRPRTVNNFLSRCELHELTEKQLYQSFQSRNFRSTVNHPYAEKQGRKQKKKKKKKTKDTALQKREAFIIFLSNLTMQLKPQEDYIPVSATKCPSVSG